MQLVAPAVAAVVAERAILGSAEYPSAEIVMSQITLPIRSVIALASS
jgi:hypothetical protein